MNKFISSCISDLENLSKGAIPAQINEDVNGHNFAISLVQDSINTRISLLKDYLNDEDSVNGVCAEFIQSAITVLNQDSNSQDDSPFGVAFKKTIEYYTKHLSILLEKYT